MSSSSLLEADKREIRNARQNAVRNAWKQEAERVRNGQGTRNWTIEEQKELLKRGSVFGYEGHHMKSVSEFPEYAGNPDNIQFLSEDEHIYGAHQGNTQNATNGYYDPETKVMHDFDGDELTPPPVIELSATYNRDEDLDITSGLDSGEGSQEADGFDITTGLDSVSETDKGESQDESMSL